MIQTKLFLDLQLHFRYFNKVVYIKF